MEKTDTQQQPTAEKTTADALTFAEHRAMREPKTVTAEPPAKDKPETEPKDEETSDSHETTSHEGTAAEPDAAETTSQDKQPKPKRDRTFDGRISELTAARRKAEQEADELRRKLADIEKGSQPAGKTETKPVAATATAAAGDEKPKLTDFLTKADPKKTYEEVHEEYLEARDAWRDRQTEAKARETAAVTARQQLKEAWSKRVTEARETHEDFDAVTAGDVNAGSGLILTPAMQHFVVQHELGAHVAYALGKDPAEAARIRALSPDMQLAELGALAHEVRGKKTAEAAEPEKTNTTRRAPVSRVAPPPRQATGATTAEPKSTAEARTMAEHRRMRESQRHA